jgi:hypothetical protein
MPHGTGVRITYERKIPAPYYKLKGWKAGRDDLVESVKPDWKTCPNCLKPIAISDKEAIRTPLAAVCKNCLHDDLKQIGLLNNGLRIDKASDLHRFLQNTFMDVANSDLSQGAAEKIWYINLIHSHFFGHPLNYAIR